ncbi:hypothetical protein SAMN05428973_113130 [Duganella sp. OV510]|nr:hypothetical protein SAMN05428973_113130 [Duganella sp. OV510]
MNVKKAPPKYEPPTGTELFVSVAIFVCLVLWNWWPA